MSHAIVDSVESARQEAGRLRRRYLVGMVLLGLLAAVAASFGLSFGAVGVPIGRVWSIVLDHALQRRTTASIDNAIIWDIRAPRVALGFIVGATLSVVGVAVQALVRNPIADPYVLGIESGASAAAVAVLYLAMSTASESVVAPTTAAFFGALGTLLLIFLLARKRGRVSSTRLLLVGVALSFALSGVTEFFIYLSPNPLAQEQLLFWVMGGLSGAQWNQIPIAAGILILTYAALRYQARPLNALAMGDASATAVGVDPDRFRIRLLVITSLAVAAVVPIAGPIGFVGLVVPHVGRMLFGAEHTRLLPAATLIGGLYLVSVDLIGRVIFAPGEVPLGVMTALLGTPFFLWLLRTREAGVE